MRRGATAMASVCWLAGSVLAAQIRFAAPLELPFVLDPSKTSRKYLLESVGGGVAMFDYDGDGRPDLYFVNGAALGDPHASGAAADKSSPRYWNRLYRNLGDGRFEDVTARAGVRGSHYGMGVAAADFDNDGDTDLYVTGFPSAQLFRNNGDGSFSDITSKAKVGAKGWSTGAAWVDFDLDGLLDLAVARYMEWDFEPDLWCGARQPGYRSYCHPDKYPPAPHALYRNLGNGRFADVSQESGFGVHKGKGLGIAIADYDLDGRIDIAIANDAAPQQLFRNLGGGKFEETGLEAGVAYDDDGGVFSGMGIDFGDIDADGRPDLMVNALAHQRYALFRNVAAAFEYASGAAGIGAASFSHSGWGMKLADLDNDGNLDLFVAQGHVMDNIELTQPGLRYKEPLLVARGLGGRFERAEEAGVKPLAARGAAFGDLNGDGAIDAVVSAQRDRAIVLMGQRPRNRWLMLRLVGSRSNRQGIGATVRATADGRTQVRVASAAGSYLSSNDTRVHFGLADARAAVVEVHWPGGSVQKVGLLEAGRVHTIREAP